MKKIGLILFGSLLVSGLSSQSIASVGRVSRQDFDPATGSVTTTVCDASTATLNMDLTGFSLHYFPENCRDAAGDKVEIPDWLFGATSVRANGDLTTADSKGRIRHNSIVYEKTSADGTVTRLRVGTKTSTEFEFILERSYPDGFKRTDTGKFQ